MTSRARHQYMYLELDCRGDNGYIYPDVRNPAHNPFRRGDTLTVHGYTRIKGLQIDAC